MEGNVVVVVVVMVRVVVGCGCLEDEMCMRERRR